MIWIQKIIYLNKNYIIIKRMSLATEVASGEFIV
jgi:hypothetical protein